MNDPTPQQSPPVTPPILGALRWRKPKADALTELFDAFQGRDTWILQQAWECQETGEVEWRDVPKETVV